MNELRPAYKQALVDARDAFNDKYAASIEAALLDVRDTYGIDQDSDLAHILRVTMRKIMQGLEHKLAFYNSWFNLHSLNSQYVAENYFEMYPAHSTDYGLIFESSEPSAELEKLIKIDIGRNRVVLHAVDLISRHAQDAEKPMMGDIPLTILGSVLKRSFQMYCQKNGPIHEVGVDFKTKSGISRLSGYRNDVRAALG